MFEKLSVSLLFLISVVMVFAILLDSSIIRISVFTGGLNSSGLGIFTFFFICFLFIVGQHVLIRFVKEANRKTRYEQFIFTTKIVSMVECVIIASLVIIIIQMLMFSNYSSLILRVIVWINYSMALILIGVLAKKFFTWYRHRRSFVVISYAIAMSVLGFNIACGLIYVTFALTGQRGQDFISAFKNPVAVVVGADNMISFLYLISSILSFILVWFSTVLLLYHYSRKIGTIRYWIIVSIPLLYFISQFQLLSPSLFQSIRISDPVLFGIIYTLLFSATKPVGGILFGIAFWSIGKVVSNRDIKNYMAISSIGIMLLISSNQPSGLALVPYPPFGLVTVSFLALAAYLILIGIAYWALSVANKTELRVSVRKSLENQQNLLDNIGTAQMDQKVQNFVTKITTELSDKISEETGINSSPDSIGN